MKAVALSVVLASVMGQALGVRANAQANRPPNIVLIVADDLGYGELGCYGQKWIRTPTLDRLAGEGLRFTQFYAGNAVCAPSRCSLLTGMHPGHAHVRGNLDASGMDDLRQSMGWEFPGQVPIPDDALTIAEVLKARGYATGAMGKWGLGHFGTSGDPNRQGFDLFYGYNCQAHAHNHYPRFLWRNATKEVLPGNDRTLSGATYAQDRFVEEAIRFVDDHRAEPFFLYLPFAVPHLSIQVPAASLAEYTGKIPEAAYEHSGYLEHPSPRAGYAAMVTHMDRGIGRLVEHVERLGLGRDTVFVFTSDNGPAYDRLGGSDSDFFDSTAGLRGRKGSLYEGGLRVPLIIRWQGHLAEGEVRTQAAAFWDLLPTLADWAGAPAPPGVDGRSLVPLLEDASLGDVHEDLYWEFRSYGGQQALRWGPWKGLRRGLAGLMPDLALELYRLDTDPTESHDVAADHPDVVQQMERRMSEARRPSALFPLRVLDVPAYARLVRILRSAGPVLLAAAAIVTLGIVALGLGLRRLRARA